VGKLNSGKIFENTRVSGIPMELTMGIDEAPVQGLELALESMRKGEIALVTVKPEYGYGKEGNLTKGVPPNSILIYEIELVEFQKAKESWEMEFPEKIEVAQKKKKRKEMNFIKRICSQKLQRNIKKQPDSLRMMLI